MIRFAFILIILLWISPNFGRKQYELPRNFALILDKPLDRSFHCIGRPYGYYADPNNDCKVFHVCQPIIDAKARLIETAHFSFLCPLGTIFSQDSRTCTKSEFAFPCEQATSLYDVSHELKLLRK